MTSTRVSVPLLVIVAGALCAPYSLAPARGPADADGAAQPADGTLRLVVRGEELAETPLDGQTLSGVVYISVLPAERPREVVFDLDSREHRREKHPPFDFQGGEPGNPNPWDTRTVADGPHEIVAAVRVGKKWHELRAVFTVRNAPPDFRFEVAEVRHGSSPDHAAIRERAVRLLGTPGTRYAIEGALPPWLGVSPTEGEAPATVVLRIDPSGLAAGEHATTLVARDGGDGSAELAVRLTVHGPGVELARSVERHGFVWELEDLHPVGRFANGDPWVVGPVRIEAVHPGWDGRTGGSMVNPRYGKRHGYDSRFTFEEPLRAAFPRLAVPGESIVSTRSWRGDEPECPGRENTLGIPRPALRSAAVLTVLAGPAPPGSFRPPYAGDDKPLHSIDDLHPERLPALPRVDGVPELGAMERSLDRVWLDHTAKWTNRYLHPSENMRDYSRDIARVYNDASLMLLLDFTAEEKHPLIVRLVQIGIDMHAVLRTGATWGDGGGGIGSGRKWPVLLAGILLDDPAMRAIGRELGPETALEDCQTFYLTEAEAALYPGSSIGDPVWGERHCTSPSGYIDPGKLGYRTCCTANVWVGAVLSAHALGARELWDHEPLFDYQDRYMSEQPRGTWQRSLSDFAESMWDTYRHRFGPRWPRD